MADRLGIDSIDREGRIVVIKFRPQAKVDPSRLVTLMRQRNDLTLAPPAALKLTLDGALPQQGAPAPRKDAPLGVPAASRSRPAKTPAAAPSWWTARARAGEVTPGFTKEAILRPTKDDPRAPGGVFERVGGLLSDLLDRM